MNCAEFRDWLDAGMLPAIESRARAHAQGCVACAAALSAQDELDLALNPERAGRLANRSRFVDQVMRRVLAADPRTQRVALWPAPPLPWWVQAAADPGTWLACAFAVLLLLRPGWFGDVARLSDRWSALEWPALAQARAAIGLDRPMIALGFGILGLFALAWLSLHLYRWSERLTRRSVGA